MAKKKDSSSLIWLILTAIFLGVGFTSPWLLVLVIATMIPAMVFAVTDDHPFRGPRLMTIAACNGIGTVIVSLEFLRHGTSMMHLMATMQNVFMWAIVMMAAATGWLLLAMAPAVAASMLQMRRGDRLRQILKARARLLEEWGGRLAGEALKDDDQDG